MKATIIYGQTVTFQVEIPVQCQGSTLDMLNYLWNATNPDSGNDTLTKLDLCLRSAMIGDIFLVHDEFWFVDGRGFVRVSNETAIHVQRIGSRATLMGYDWLVERHDFPPPIAVIR